MPAAPSEWALSTTTPPRRSTPSSSDWRQSPAGDGLPEGQLWSHLTLEDVVVDLDVAEAPGLAHDARLGSDRGRHQDAAAGLVRRVEVDALAVALQLLDVGSHGADALHLDHDRANLCVAAEQVDRPGVG